MSYPPTPDYYGENGSVSVASGASVTVGGAVALNTGSTLSVSGTASKFKASGVLTTGAGSSSLEASQGGSIQLGGLSVPASASSSGSAGSQSLFVSVDGSSTIEIGAAGGAAAGALTIDAGQTVTLASSTTLVGATIDNGVISETAGLSIGRNYFGMTTPGSLAGTGVVDLGANTTLTLEGAAAAGLTLDFTGADSTIEIGAASTYNYTLGASVYQPYAVSATLSDMAAGDGIVVDNETLTNAVYAYGGANAGTLTLYAGTAAVETLDLAGNYTGRTFFISPTTSSGSAVLLLSNAGPGSSPVSTNSDSFTWIGSSGGSWDSASDWEDTTSGANPATSVPGVNNGVTIPGPTGSIYEVISGGGGSASLGVTGFVDLVGAYGTGGLSVGSVTGSPGGAAFASAGLTLGASSTLTATTANVIDGALTISGSGALLTASGAVTVGSPAGDDILVAGQTYSYSQGASGTLGVGAGGTLSAASLKIANGSLSASGAGASVAVSGALSVGTAAAGSYSYPPTPDYYGENGSVSVASGASVTVGGAVALNTGSTLSVSGTASKFKASGVLTTGAGSSSLEASQGGSIQLGGLSVPASASSSGSAGSQSLYVSVDGSSTIEIGAAGGAAAGALTIDAGQTVTLASSTTLVGATIDNGVISETAGLSIGRNYFGMTTPGSLAGTGVVDLGANTTLTLEGAAAAGLTLDFTGADSTIEIGAASTYNYTLGASVYQPYAVSATLSDMAAGDGIVVDNETLTNAVYAYGGANAGTLTLYAGTAAVETLDLAGNYTGRTFFISPTTSSGSAVALLARPGTTIPTSEAVLVGVATSLGGFAISDSNSQASSTTVTLSDTNGVFSASSAGGASVTPTAAGATLAISGSVSEVNAALATLSFESLVAGTDTIDVSDKDSLGSVALAAAVPVTVLPIAPPVVNVPAAALAEKPNVGGAVAGVSITYPDGAVAGETVSVAVSDARGLLNVNAASQGGGGTVGGTGTPHLTIQGTLAQVNADLATLTYASSTPGAESVTVSATGTHGGPGVARSFSVETIGLPKLVAPTTATVGLNQATPIGGVTLTQTPSLGSETFKVTLSDATGLLAATGTDVTGSGTTSLTIQGGLGAVDDSLATLTDTGELAGSDTVAIAADDSLGDVATPASITVSAYNLAKGAISGSPVNFGAVHVGATPTQALTISNVATPPAQDLDATISSADARVTATGAVANLAPGASDASSLKVGIVTSAPGLVDGDATVALQSVGTGQGASSTQLSSQTVIVTGAVYAEAAPALTHATLNLGAARVGASPAPSASATLTNGVAASAYQESLKYSLAGALAGFVATAPTSGTILAGQSAALNFALNTSQAGAFSTTQSVALVSTGLGTSGLADSPLAPASVALSGKVYAPAVASLSATSVNFGVVHVDDAVNASLGVKNTASGALTDVLNGKISTSAGFDGSGSLVGVAAGASGGFTLGVDTSEAGVFTGTASLALTSHDADLADVAVNAPTVALTATVNNYADPVFEEVSGGGSFSRHGDSYTLALGDLAVDAAPSEIELAVANAVEGPADLLSGDFSVSGAAIFQNDGFDPFTGVAAGDAQSGLDVAIDLSEAGSFSETIVLHPEGSNASGYEGALPDVTLTITGTTQELANPSVNPTSVDFGGLRLNQDASQAISVSNTASAAAQTLDASASAAGDATVSGAISQLAGGAGPDTSIVVGLDTSNAGQLSGDVTLDFSSDDGKGDVTPLPSSDVGVSGTVYNEASFGPSATTPVIVHVGDSGDQTLTISNTAPAPYSENLVAQVTGVTGAVSVTSDSTGEIAPQADGAIGYTIDASAAGEVTGVVSLQYLSDGVGTDNAAPTAIGAGDAAIDVTVNNYANPEFVTPDGELSGGGDNLVLDLGSVTQGDDPIFADLSVLNAAAAPADSLSGSYKIMSGGGFTNSGFAAIADVAAGDQVDAGEVELDTGSVGAFSETIELDPTGSNDGGYSGSLTARTITIEGTVVAPPPAAASLDVPPTSTSPAVDPSSVVPAPSPPTLASGSNADGKIDTPSPLDLGVVRVGETAEQALSVSNTASSPGPALDVSVDYVTGDATADGSISALAAGDTDTTSIQVGVDTSTAGAKSGTVALLFESPDDPQTTQTSQLDFETDDQSMWQSGASGGFSQNWTYFDASVGPASASASSTLASVSGSASASAALTGSLSATTGSVSVDYPLNITTSTPTSVAPGEEFTVYSEAAGLGDASLDATLPQISDVLTLDLAASASLSASALGFGTTVSSGPLDTSVELAKLTAGAPPQDFGVPASGFSLELDIPTDYEDTDSTTGAGYLPSLDFTGTTGDVISAKEDLFTLLARLTGTANPLSGDYKGVEYNLATLDLSGGLALAQNLVFLPTGVTETVTPNFDSSAKQSGPLGTAFSFVAPTDWTGPVQLTTDYQLAGDLVNQTGVVGSLSLDFSALEAKLELKGVSESFGPLIDGPSATLYEGAPSYFYTSSPFAVDGFADQSSTLDIPLSTSATGGADTPANQSVDVQATVDNYADPVIESDGGLSGGGDSYLLDLGSTLVGGSLSGSLSVRNGAPTDLPADLLAGSFLLGGGDLFDNSGFDAFSDVAAGELVEGGDVSVSSDEPGTFSETVELLPESDNDSESPAALAPVTVVVEGTFTLPPPPPLPPPDLPPTSTVEGCPHFTTFDGLHYDFQGAGEFIAAKSTASGDSFQVQMRIEPEGSSDSSVSIITQIAVQVGKDRVTFAPDRGDVVSVDGVAVAIDASNPVFTLPGGTITEVSSDDYLVVENTGERVTINPFGDGMGLSIALAPGQGAGSVEGFFGTDSGQADDFMLPDGTVLKQPLSQDDLYQTFANAWRVTDATSLLDYAAGQTTATFTNMQYPRQILTLADLPADLVAEAASLVAAAGITDPTLAADAEFDYITMGNPSFITQDAAVYSENPVTPTAATVTGHTAPTPTIGVIAAASTVTETSGGGVKATFYVNLTSAAAVDTVIDYAVTPNVDYLANPSGQNNSGKTFFDAADFGGALPTGEVTIAAGATEATFTVSLPATALGSAPEKWLGVSITSASADPIYNPTAQTEIVSAVPTKGTPALPTLGLLPLKEAVASSGGAALTAKGDDYTLDLGDVLKGASLPDLQFYIANAAALGADSLQSGVTLTSGSGFALTGVQPNLPIAAGGEYDDLYLQPATTALGANTELLTFSAEETDDTGSSGYLPSLTLTLKDNVIAPAKAGVTTSSVTFANVRIGAAESQQLVFEDLAASGAANLDATASPSGDATATGAVNGLAPGATSSAIAVGLDTSAAGARSGTVTLKAASDLGDGVAVPALPYPAVQVSGGVYREGSAALAPAKTIVHVDDPGTLALVVSNADPADSYSEGLEASVVGSSGAIAASGSTGDVAAGASNSSSLTATFSTAQSGVVSGGVKLDVVTDGTCVDGLGKLDLGASSVPISITVDNYAVAAFKQTSGGGAFTQNGSAYTLDLSQINQNSGAFAIGLAALNAAPGVADFLSGAFQSTKSSAFSLSGLSAFTGLAAGQTDSGLSVTLDTSATGSFSETITLDGVGSNASGYSAAVTPITLTIEAEVVPAVLYLNAKQYLANPGAADRFATGFTLRDSASAVSSIFDLLNADTHLNAVELTDAGTPALSLTAKQADDDASVLSKIVGGYRIYVGGVLVEQLIEAGGTFRGVSYTSYLLDYSPSGFHDLTQLYDAGGDVVASESFTTDGGDKIYVGGVLVEQLVEAGGTFRGVSYTSYLLDYSSTGFHDLTRLYDASGNVVASETFQSNGGYAIDVQNQLSEQKTVNPDGSYEISYFNITGQKYTSFNEIFEAGGHAAIYALNDVDTSGALTLYTNGASVSVSGAALSVALRADSFDANADTFNLTYHNSEVINAAATSNDVFGFAAPTNAAQTPWQDAINGFVATGAGSDAIQFNASAFGASNATDAWANLLAAATTNSAGWEVIHDNSHDALTLNGVNRATLLASQSDFKFV